MVVLNISFRKLISNLSNLLLLLNWWILINIHQISNDSAALILLLLWLFSALVHFITCGHVIIEVLIYNLVLILNLLSLIALATIIVVQTLFDHSDAAAVVALLINLISISIVSVAWCQEVLCLWIDISAAAALCLSTSNEKLTLLPLACSMLINNIYLAIGDILTRIHHRLVSAFLFILSLLSSETLV